MANTFTQIRIQIVFAVKSRKSMIPKSFKNEFEKIITGAIQKRRHKLLAVSCMPDHIHILIGLHTSQALSVLVEQIKKASRNFINKQPWMKHDFEWQRGYGAFSYSKSQTDYVVKYILNQEEHHRKKSFKEEYIELLEEFDIPYDPQYLFKFVDLP